jgi:hypothetical protein
MRTRHSLLWLPALAFLITACGAPIAAREVIEDTAAPAPLPQYPPDSCPITRPQDPVFVPPEPYSSVAPYGDFWYGSKMLWTALQPDGRWYALPRDREGYSQKVFWWREGYSMTVEPQPRITISGRRLDGDAPAFEQTGGTNGYHADLGEFMLTGVGVPTAGCWEITGRYGEVELTFVVWVAP